MLFRATGPYSECAQAGKPPPFPIFLGYAWSDDGGSSWKSDFSRPALAPQLSSCVVELYLTNSLGRRVVNHANGCIEDPRLFLMDGECYLTVACRMFSPGPYWIKDDPMQCAPQWARAGKNPLGRAASENVTVSVLFKVNLAALSGGDYGSAFEYCCHLTDPALGENRDVVLFPERLRIDSRDVYACLHRPWEPRLYSAGITNCAPSILCGVAEKLEDLAASPAQTVLASPIFDWEGDRIGASAPLLQLSKNTWLLSYHGKKDSIEGYTQSFMILDTAGGLPVVKHRCSDRLLYPVETWEMPGRFKTPVIFVTGMIQIGDELLLGYGAADERVGVCRMDLPVLLEYLETFDAQGGRS